MGLAVQAVLQVILQDQVDQVEVEVEVQEVEMVVVVEEDLKVRMGPTAVETEKLQSQDSLHRVAW